MKKFEEYTYERPDLDEVKVRFHDALNLLKKAEGMSQQVEAIEKISQIRMEVDTMENLVYIRHSIDTNDDFYKAEQDYMDELSPEIHGLVTEFYHVLLESPYRKELEKKWGGSCFHWQKARSGRSHPRSSHFSKRRISFPQNIQS